MKSKKKLFAPAAILIIIGIGTMAYALPQTFSGIVPLEKIFSAAPKTVGDQSGTLKPSGSPDKFVDGDPSMTTEKISISKGGMIDNSGSEIPEQVVYLFLFREVAAFEAKAAEAERLGENGANYRTVYQRTANLSAEQNEFLRKTATDCAAEVKIKDEAAKKIGERLRGEYQAQLNAGTAPPVPPSSPELTELQKQRDEIVLKYRDLLKENFGESFPRFETYVENHITSNIKTNTKSGGAKPAPDMERLSKSETPIAPAPETNGEEK